MHHAVSAWCISIDSCNWPIMAVPIANRPITINHRQAARIAQKPATATTLEAQFPAQICIYPNQQKLVIG